MLLSALHAAVLAAALGVYAANLRSRINALEIRLQEATDRAAAGERQLAELRRVSAEAQNQVAVLAAPDLQRIDLAGQPRAPQASARAFWSGCPEPPTTGCRYVRRRSSHPV